jgi:hypothetical protein
MHPRFGCLGNTGCSAKERQENIIKIVRRLSCKTRVERIYACFSAFHSFQFQLPTADRKVKCNKARKGFSLGTLELLHPQRKPSG